MAEWPTLRIEGGPTGREVQVYLDGQMVQGCRGISFDTDVQGVNTVILRMYVGKVEIDAVVRDVFIQAVKQEESLPPDLLDTLTGEVLQRLRRAGVLA